MAEPDLSGLPEIDDTDPDLSGLPLIDDGDAGFGPWRDPDLVRFPDQEQPGYTRGPDEFGGEDAPEDTTGGLSFTAWGSSGGSYTVEDIPDEEAPAPGFGPWADPDRVRFPDQEQPGYTQGMPTSEAPQPGPWADPETVRFPDQEQPGYTRGPDEFGGEDAPEDTTGGLSFTAWGSGSYTVENIPDEDDAPAPGFGPYADPDRVRFPDQKQPGYTQAAVPSLQPQPIGPYSQNPGFPDQTQPGYTKGPSLPVDKAAAAAAAARPGTPRPSGFGPYADPAQVRFPDQKQPGYTQGSPPAEAPRPAYAGSNAERIVQTAADTAARLVGGILGTAEASTGAAAPSSPPSSNRRTLLVAGGVALGLTSLVWIFKPKPRTGTR